MPFLIKSHYMNRDLVILSLIFQVRQMLITRANKGPVYTGRFFVKS